MTATFEENEARRLDLVERELAIKERLLEREVLAIEADVTKRQTDWEKDLAYRVEHDAKLDAERAVHIAATDGFLRHHGEILDRVAAALERIADLKAL